MDQCIKFQINNAKFSMNRNRHEFEYKIILVGDIDVGKTCYMSRFIKNAFSTHTPSTIGVELDTKFVTLRNGKVIKAKIWDTSGQEKYKSITTAHYHQCAGALLFFDLTNLTSFENTIEWINEIKENTEEVGFWGFNYSCFMEKGLMEGTLIFGFEEILS